MKTKTINSVITKKFKEWVDTIKDPKVADLVKANTIATGGCIASMKLKEVVNDFDFYFRNKQTCKAVAEYYAAEFNQGSPTSHTNGTQILAEVRDKDERISIYIKSAGVASENGASDYRYFETTPGTGDTEEYVDKAVEVLKDVEDDKKPKYRPVFLSDNAITLSQHVQLVLRFYGEPAQIHDNYDFVHCTNYWTSWDKAVVLNLAALDALLDKDLRYIGSKYPICSLIRMRKFIGRGWTINAGQILKICMQINELKLTDVNVLQEQLVGVDVAYFHQILDYLKEKMDKDGTSDKNLTSAYLIEIIDRLF